MAEVTALDMSLDDFIKKNALSNGQPPRSGKGGKKGPGSAGARGGYKGGTTTTFLMNPTAGENGLSGVQMTAYKGQKIFQKTDIPARPAALQDAQQPRGSDLPLTLSFPPTSYDPQMFSLPTTDSTPNFSAFTPQPTLPFLDTSSFASSFSQQQPTTSYPPLNIGLTTQEAFTNYQPDTSMQYASQMPGAMNVHTAAGPFESAGGVYGGGPAQIGPGPALDQGMQQAGSAEPSGIYNQLLTDTTFRAATVEKLMKLVKEGKVKDFLAESAAPASPVPPSPGPYSRTCNTQQQAPLTPQNSSASLNPASSPFPHSGGTAMPQYMTGASIGGVYGELPAFTACNPQPVNMSSNASVSQLLALLKKKDTDAPPQHPPSQSAVQPDYNMAAPAPTASTDDNLLTLLSRMHPPANVQQPAEDASFPNSKPGSSGISKLSFVKSRGHRGKVERIEKVSLKAEQQRMMLQDGLKKRFEVATQSASSARSVRLNALRSEGPSLLPASFTAKPKMKLKDRFDLLRGYKVELNYR
ncbi:hypothetical protein DIPPA_13937 [Diplonema papillatum]|nr:hypothetical protein DIPPA_13937 [Diplonema papillatum]